jgi:hypothetical protein
MKTVSATDRARMGSRAGAASLRAKADQRAAGLAGVVTEISAAGVISGSGTAKALNARGVPTVRARAWNPCTADRLLRRLANMAASQVAP